MYKRNRTKKTQRIAILTTMAIFLTLSISRCLSPEVTFNRFHKDDAAFFYTMAYNLAAHGKYAINTSALFPFQPHGTWPPVWPIFLAAWIKLFSMGTQGLSIVNVFLSVANLWVFHSILTKHSQFLRADHFDTKPAATVALVATAFSPVYFCFSRTLMPEVLFLLLSNIALLGILQATSIKVTATTALTTSLAFLTRGYAVLLIPIFLLRTLWEPRQSRKKRIVLAAIFLSITGCTVLGWSQYSRQISKLDNADFVTKKFGTTSELFVHDSFMSFIKNDIYWRQLPSLGEISNPLFFRDVFNPPLSDFAVVTGAYFLLMSIVGMFCVARKNEFILPAWTILNIVFIIVGGLTQLRYWINVYPYMFYFSAIAVLNLPGLPPKFTNIRQFAIYGWLLSMLVAFANSYYTQHDDYYAEYWREYSQAMHELQRTLPTKTVIVDESPQKAFMTTHFDSINYAEAKLALQNGLKDDTGDLVFVTTFRKQTNNVHQATQLLLELGLPTEHLELFQGKHLTIFKCAPPNAENKIEDINAPEKRSGLTLVHLGKHG